MFGGASLFLNQSAQNTLFYGIFVMEVLTHDKRYYSNGTVKNLLLSLFRGFNRVHCMPTKCYSD